MEISELLVSILRETNSDWALIWQLHNGGTNLNGFPFLKLSATHEQTRIHFEHIAQLYQNLPTSLFIDGTKECNISKISSETVCVNDNSIAAVKGIMSAHGMKSMHICSLRSAKGLLVGFLTVSFSDQESISEDVCDILDEYAERAQILLEFQTRLERR